MATNPYPNPYRSSYGYDAGGMSGITVPNRPDARDMPTPPPAPTQQDLLGKVGQQPLPNLNYDLYMRQQRQIADQLRRQLAQTNAQVGLQQQLNALIDPMLGYEQHQQRLAMLNERPPSTFTFLYGY